MKKAVIFFAFFWGVSALTMSQAPQLPKQVKVGKPEILKPQNGTYKRDDLEREFKPGGKWGTKKMVNEFWVVRSDRNRNPVYADALKTRTLTTMLAFNQPVVICEVKGDMALVYEDNKMEKYPEIPSYAKSIGWVPMEQLLLWDACPTDQRGVQYKALIAINLNKLNGGKIFKGMYYKDPEKNEDPQNLAMDMKFYFIMKESANGQRVLLCENPTVFGNNLYGWVDDNAFSRWNQRACLEPNWNPQYADSHKGQEVGVYADKNLSSGNKVTSWEYGKSNGDKDEWFQYRMSPSQLRFPIIEKVDEQANWLHCTSYADKTGKANFGEELRNTTEQVKKVQQLRGQMNVILAIEATTEMSEIMPAVKKSLAKCRSFSGTGLQIKVGVVLYRGTAQGANGLEIVPLTGYDDPLVLSKLESAKANGRLSAKERNVALSLAIEKATDASNMGFKKDQKNLLLVIGSRGAPESDHTFTDSKLLKKLYDNNIQVMSIQVTKNPSGSWVNFNDQMVDLIKGNVNKQYEGIKDKADFKLRKQGDGYNFNATFKENLLFAQIRYSKELGTPLSAEEVIKYIDNGINGFAEASKKWDNYFEESLGDIQFDPAFLKRYLGEAGFERWKQVKAISAFDGFTRRKDMKDNDYWHYILYLSGDELQKLLADLKPAYEIAAGKMSDDRKPYIDAMRALVKTHLGQSNDKGIDNMDEDQLQELIYGLDVHTKIATRRKLKDIADPRVVTSIEYQKMLSNFKDNYEKLLRSFTDGYTYRTKFGKDWYYWIPIEDLP